MWYNKKTKKKLTDEEYYKLSDAERKTCVPDRGSSKPDNGPGRKKQDSAWYQIDNNLTNAVASLPFNVFAGVDQTLKYVFNEAMGEKQVQYSIPGVLVMQTILAYGSSADGTSAINIAAKALYSFVRHMNSGRTNYESPDLMMYVMAMSQIYAMIAEAQKWYKLAITYTYKNKYIPEGIAAACSVNLKSIADNLADFRYRLNMLVAKVSALCIPKAFNIHKRHAYIMGNVFVDSDDLRGQFYVYAPTIWLRWDATAEKTGSSLQAYHPTVGTGGLRSNESIINDVETCIAELINDEDANIMSGDILKAFGADGLYSLAEVPENATADFIFNEDVLQQIENAQAIAYAAAEYAIIQQNNSIITVDKTFTQNDYVSLTTAFFNSHKSNPTPDDVLEWSRSICMVSPNRGEVTYGTEILTGYSIYVQHKVGNEFYSFTNNLAGSGGSPGNEIFHAVASAELFDWHPILYIYTGLGTSVPNLLDVAGDLKMTAMIDYQTAKRLNDYAIMGALNSLNMIANAKAIPTK